MYPEITPLIRAAIKRRYEILPYLYSLSLESHMTATPPQRWIGWGYESDKEVWTPEVLKGETQYWLGDSLMVGGVYQSGETSAKLYLPVADTEAAAAAPQDAEKVNEYINLSAPYQHLPGGAWTTIASEWQDSIPLLAKIGGAIPIGKSIATRSSTLETKEEFPSLADDDYRGVEIFPPKGSSDKIFSNTWYEDDGLSAEKNLKISAFTITYRAELLQIHVGFYENEKNAYVPLWKDLSVVLPVGDEREIVGLDGQTVVDMGRTTKGRRVFKVTI